jgi:PAS domain S-box-containing protein
MRPATKKVAAVAIALARNPALPKAHRATSGTRPASMKASNVVMPARTGRGVSSGSPSASVIMVSIQRSRSRVITSTISSRTSPSKPFAAEYRPRLGSRWRPCRVRLQSRASMRTLALAALFTTCFVLAGSAAGLGTHEVLAGYEKQRVSVQFEEYLTDRSHALKVGILTAFEALHSLRALFESREEVTREEFATFVRGALARHPSVQAMEWVPRVPGSDREAHEAQGRASGLTGYVITDRLARHADARMCPAPRRAEYFPAFFVEPYEGNERALGFDLGSDAIRRTALARAVETGRVTLTDPIVLVQEKGSSKGVLAILPVSEREGGPAQPTRASIQGFVVAVFRVADVIREARFAPEGQASRMRYELSGIDSEGEPLVLHASAGWMHDVAAAARASVKQVRVGGQEWRLAGRPTEAFLSQRRTAYPVAMAVGAFVLVGVAGGLVLLLARRSRSRVLRRRDRSARNVTARIESEELVRRLSSAVEQTADAVLITDRDGEILYVNPAFETTTGYASGEVLGKTPRVLKSGEHDLEHYQKLWATVLGGEVFRATIVNRKKNGDLYYAEQSITPMKDESGRVTHFVSVSKDMTEHRRIQEQAIEMRVAATVQERLYPEVPPEVPGLDIAGAVFPAEATCGDYFDFIAMGNDRLGLVIGDVSGHGLGPALVMAQTRAYLRAFAETEHNAAEILRKVNKVLSRDLQSGFFVTMLFVVVDVSAGRLMHASAGHTEGYILDRRGEVKQVLAGTGIPLGIDAGSLYDMAGDTALEPGDLAVLITDGVTESRSPQDELFGTEGALAAVKASCHEPARRIVEHVHDTIREFRGGQRQRDDITMVVCRLDGLPVA